MKKEPDSGGTWDVNGLYPFVLKSVTSNGAVCRNCSWHSARCLGCFLEADDESTVHLRNLGSFSLDSNPNPNPNLRNLDSFSLDWELDYFDVTEEGAATRHELVSKTPSNRVLLTQCLDNYVKPEMLEGEDAAFCEECKVKTSSKKTTTIWKMPDVVVHHLKRFETSYVNGPRGFEVRTTKMHTLVEFPLDGLDMGPYFSEKPSESDALYDLVGVVNHLGNLNSGHYIAYCRNPFSKKWYVFNDRTCKEMDANCVVSTAAYILFYEVYLCSSTFNSIT